MGLVKHLIPRTYRERGTSYLKANLPEIVQKQTANAITVSGFILKLIGRRYYGTKKGLAAVTGSLFSDDADGDWARAFDATSIGGKYLDMVFNDKLGLAVLLPKLWEANKDLPVRRAALGLIAAKHAAISTMNGVEFISGTHNDRTMAGAVNWYNDCMVMGFIAIGDTFSHPKVQKAVDAYVIAGSVAGLVTGAAAIGSYLPKTLEHNFEMEDQLLVTGPYPFREMRRLKS